MTRMIHARLSEEDQRLLRRLRRDTGLTESEIVRRGLRALAAPRVSVRRRIVGLGRFASGVTDLGSNKAHLAGFGRR